VKHVKREIVVMKKCMKIITEIKTTLCHYAVLIFVIIVYNYVAEETFAAAVSRMYKTNKN